MMKARIATVISFAGVLVAGSSAALVNTQVLSGSSPSPLVAEAASQPEQTTSTDVAARAAPPVAAAPVVAAAPTPVATQAVYTVGDSGSVTLDTAGDVLTIVSSTPATGWTVIKSESGDGLDAEIVFQSGTVEVQFDASLLFGVVTTSVESHDSSASSDSVESTDNTVGSTDDTTSDDSSDDSASHTSGSDDSASHGRGGDDD